MASAVLKVSMTARVNFESIMLFNIAELFSVELLIIAKKIQWIENTEARIKYFFFD